MNTKLNTTEYSEVMDFDADILRIEACIKQALEIASKPEMLQHIRDTDEHLEVDTSDEHATLLAALKKAQRKLSHFYCKMQNAC